MKKKILFLSTLLTAGIGILSCGGGSGGSSSSTPVSSSDTYLPYMASIDFVDPGTLSIKTIESKKVLYASGSIKALKYDKNSYDFEYDYVVYITDEGNRKGKVFKVSLRKDGSQTPVQISNVSDACEVIEDGDYQDNDATYLFIKTAGNNGECDNTDDKLVLINTKMSSSDTPIDASQIKHVFDSFADFNNNLKISGFLVLTTDNKLQKCDTNLQNCNDILTVNSNYDTVSYYDIIREEFFLCLDNRWIKISNDGSYSDTTVACDYKATWTSDKDYIYFYTEDGSGNKFVKKMSKSDYSVVNLYSSSNDISIVGNTIDNVVIVEYDNGNYTIKAINKSNGSVIDITTSRKYTYDSIYKNFVVYTDYDVSDNMHACFWDENTNTNDCNQNVSYWGGDFVKKSGKIDLSYSDGSGHNTNLEMYKIILVENNKDIYSVNPDNLNDKTYIGSIPNNYEYPFVDYIANLGFLSAFDKNTHKKDLFILDVDKKCIKQITNTPDKDEEPII